MSQPENNLKITQWNYNDLILELDMQDAEDLKRYEEAFAALGEAEKNCKKDGPASEQIIAFCNMFRDLFDALFGEGTAEKMFGNKYNAAIVMEAYDQFLAFAQNQTQNAAIKRAGIIERYSPNRAQRRAAAKGHN